MKHIFVLLLIAASLPAATEVWAVRVDDRPDIDGVMDDAIWEQAVPLRENFIQHRPDCGEPMSEETEIRVLYDDEYLYFGFRMFDEHPEDFVRMVAPRDNDFSSEWTGVWLDTFNDDNNAYYFFVNVDNVQQDGRLCEVGGWDSNWDGVWESSTSVSDWGWTAEMAIPLASLRYSESSSQVWGINFKRTMTRTNESAFMFRMEDDGDVVIRDFGNLRGLEDLPSNRQVELRPYGAGRLMYVKDDEEPWDPWANAGIDARIGLSSQMLLDLTVNPDFGQVEADPDQVNLSHWETYLSEKRPFFLEGSDMFSMPFNLFYSRRIGAVAPNGDIIPILGGAKLTGAAGGFRIGLLEAYTGSVDEDGTPCARQTSYTAGRVVREFGDGTYIGLSGTSTDVPSGDGFDYSYGRSGALDLQISFLEDHEINAAAAGTWNSVQGEWKDNLAYRGWYEYDNGRFDASCGINHRQELFDANMIGYTSATGQVETWADAGIYHPFMESSTLQYGWAGLVGWYDKVPDGPVTARGASFNGGIVFRNRYHVAINVGYDGSWTDRYEGPDGTEYNGGMNYGFDCSSDYRDPLHGNLWAGINTYCEGLNRYSGTWIEYRPIPNFTLETDLEWSTTTDARKYNWQTGDWEERDTDWRSAEISANWMFTGSLGLRLTSQMSRFWIRWNSAPCERQYDHWLNILLSWRFSPGSMFYFMAGENGEPDEITGDPGIPEFTLYSKLTWFIPI